MPVDLFFLQHDFHDVVARRVRVVPLLDTTITVIDPSHLTVFKAMFDRTRDWADIEELIEAGEIDPGEVRHWLQRTARS